MLRPASISYECRWKCYFGKPRFKVSRVPMKTDKARVFRVVDFTVTESHSADYPLLTVDPYPHNLLISFSMPTIQGVDHELSIDFSHMCQTLLSHSLREEKFQGTQELAEELCLVALTKFDVASEVIVTVEMEWYGRQRPEKVVLTVQRSKDGSSGKNTLSIKGLNFKATVGLYEWESMERNIVSADILLLYDPWQGGKGADLGGLLSSLYHEIDESDDLTLNALGSSIAQTALSYGSGSTFPPKEATVKLTKLTKAQGTSPVKLVEVEVTRTAEHLADSQNLVKPIMPSSLLHNQKSGVVSKQKHIVTIAIGSNIGDRYAYIENALREIEGRHELITITGTSFLYESEPMYFEDQAKFLNCAIMAETTLQPTDLLKFIKDIEGTVGRIKSSRNGPRVIDLDIVLYDSIIFDNRRDGGDGSKEGELVIPHARMCEREFVLRPLNDIMPNYIHPFFRTTISALFKALLASNPSTLHKVFSFPSPQRYPNIPSTLWPLSLKTYLMATINATPDSFSSLSPSTTPSAVDEALIAAADGADIIDVGGYSTRPGATPVSPEEELNRVIPVVRKIREQGIMLPISVDTFRPAVIRAAVDAGANCLNDVTALAGDGSGAPEEMAGVVRELGIPVVMMHSRGAHRAGEFKDYGEPGILTGVQRELGKNVDLALRYGVRRWNVLVDPGFGFSKTTDGNLELLGRFRELTAPRGEDRRASNPLEGFPTLAGLSRKSFLGNLLGRRTDPQDRNWATAAAVTAAVQQGADVVRVHRVAETKDVLRIADALWRKVRR